MEGGLLSPNFHQPNQQQQRMMMGCFSSPPPWRTGALPSGTPANSPLSMRQLLTDLLEKEREETDRYLRLQTNRLIMALHQQRKQHMTSLLWSLDSNVSSLLKQKETELANARKRTAELEAWLKRAEQERQKWQRIAKENEAIAVSLNRTLEQLREPCLSFTSSPDAEPAASCSGHPLAAEEPGAGMRPCKSCGSRYSRVLLLPCRHLCVCELCDPFLDSCPLCRSVKEDSMEVFLV